MWSAYVTIAVRTQEKFFEMQISKSTIRHVRHIEDCEGWYVVVQLL